MDSQDNNFSAQCKKYSIGFQFISNEELKIDHTCHLNDLVDPQR